MLRLESLAKFVRPAEAQPVFLEFEHKVAALSYFDSETLQIKRQNIQ